MYIYRRSPLSSNSMELFEFENQEYSIVKILSKEDPHLPQIQAIYNEAFPRREVVPFGVILKKYDEGIEEFFYCLKNDGIMAIAFFAVYNDPSFLLLDYFAVKSEGRGKGIGTRFLSKLLGYCGEKYTNSLIMAEVEDPNFGEKRKMKEKRIRFYQRLGMKLVTNVSYILPPLNEIDQFYNYFAKSELFSHLKLLLWPPANLKNITPTEFSAIISKLYVVHYRLSRYHALLDYILENLPETLQFL